MDSNRGFPVLARVLRVADSSFTRGALFEKTFSQKRRYFLDAFFTNLLRTILLIMT